jgi:hypothetical protein
LIKVNLKSNNIRNEGVEIIFKNLIEDSKLIYLDLSNNEINYKGVKIISKYINENISLSILILDDNNLDYEGCKFINKLLTKKNNITELSLANTNIEKGIKLIFEGISKNRMLEKINLSNNNLNNYKNDIIPCINYLNLNTTLIKISLEKNLIDDDFINIIYKNIIPNEIIINVSLKLNEITDKSFENLKNISKMIKSLIYFNLSGNYLSENNINEIEKILFINNNNNKTNNNFTEKKKRHKNSLTSSKKINFQTLVLDSSESDY